MRRRLFRFGALAAVVLPSVAMAEDATPANTLADLGRQFSACMATRPLERSGSQMTIAFAMKRDGSVFGKPRITYSHLEGDAATRQRFVASVGQAVGSCLPMKVTPALGGAIAGRVFTITLGGKGDGA
jgi:hypothetical protein